MSTPFLPTLNACLNAAAAVAIVTGVLAIRRRRIAVHRAAMLTAFGVSTAFLASYLIYHYQAGSRPFPGEGWVRRAYLTLLLTHTVLAVAIVPLVLVTLYRALTRQFARHVRVARWAFPIWLYVSVTGVVVYWMLYGG
jgi:putative membrane protein